MSSRKERGGNGSQLRCLIENSGYGNKNFCEFTDEKATCEDIFVMLLVEKFFETFTKKKICDATKNTEVIVALSVES